MNAEQICQLLVQKNILITEAAGELSLKAAKGALTQTLVELIRNNKPELVSYLQAQSGLAIKEQPVDAIKRQPKSPGAVYPLSFAQQRLWFIDQMAGGSAQYNMPEVLRIEGAFDIDAAEQAISRIIERHHCLRTSYAEQGGKPVQSIHPSFDFKLARYDLSESGARAQKARMRALIDEDSERVFDLKSDLLIRASYLSLSASSKGQQGILLFNLHHIASDGWSTGILLNEFVTQYQAVLAGQPDPLPPLAIQYSDYAQWQRDHLEDEVVPRQLDYWQKQLEQVPPLHNLPLDYPRLETASHVTDVVTGEVSSHTSANLTQLALAENVTLFVLLHAVLGLVLARYSNSSDIVIGTPVANRLQAQLEGLIGCFVNTLVLRTDCRQQGFSEYLSHVANVNLDAQANQDVPFEQLVDLTQVPRDAGYNPLVQVMFNMNTNESTEVNLPGLDISPVEGGAVVAKFDLSIDAQMTEKGILLCWRYDTSLFSRATIEQMNRHFQRLLIEVTEQPQADISALSMLSAADIHYLTETLNRGDETTAQTQTIGQVFESQVQQTPNQIALAIGQQRFTYQQLNQSANRLAHYLRAHGVTNGTLVGLCVSRSAQMVIAVMAILKAGGAYVPLDPGYPKARLEQLLLDTGLKYLLSQQRHTEVLSLAEDIAVIELDAARHTAQMLTYSTANLPNDAALTPNSLAYVTYTSGSSGQPKGVMIEHRSVVGLCDRPQFVDIDSITAVLAISSIVFDGSVFDLFVPLLNGKTTVVMAEDELTDMAQWQSLSELHNVNTLFVTTALFNQLVNTQQAVLERFSQLLFGGEQANVATIAGFLQRYPHNRLIHVYGPTEATVYATFTALTLDNYRLAPIGRPVNDKSLYLLDANRQLVPFGAEGELYIGGGGVARGYLNQPQMTADKFIGNPFKAETGDLLYQTGDRVRYLSDGNLVFCGRIDEQVKIRGLRIELGEIESHLSAFDGVASAMVIVDQSSQGQKRLVAYVQPASLEGLTQRDFGGQFTAQLQAQLQSLVPSFMVPSQWLLVKQWPLTANGKIDKKRLPTVDPGSPADAYEAPVTPSELQLVEIWAGLLNLQPRLLGVTANFFELGGDSIISIQLVTRAAEQGLHFSVKDLFTAQTIRQLARVAKQGVQVQAPQHEIGGELPLLPIQRAFFADETDISHFNQAVMLTAPPGFNGEVLASIVNQLYQRHDALRLRFVKQAQGWRAQHVGFKSAMVDAAVAVKQWPDATFDGIGAFADQIQQSLSLDAGRLFRAVYITAQDGGECRGRLLLVIHHLVVDGVSWRVLLSDIESLYGQWQAQLPLRLAAKTSSYQQWANFLENYADSETLQQQKPYWLAAFAKPVKSLAQSTANTLDGSANQQGDGTASFGLSEAQTTRLLSRCNQTYRTQINELLLGGLLLGIHRFSGIGCIRIDLEGHGREVPGNELDLSQTLGWFTSVYPLTLSLDPGDSLEAVICAVKEQYRALPNNGLGFGVLRYLADDPQFHSLASSELVFNYLGQFDQVVNQDSFFSAAIESSGNCASQARKESHPLSLNGMVANGCLSFTLSYDSEKYGHRAMQSMMARIAQSLDDIIDHCVTTQRGCYTPSDFPLARLNSGQLQQFEHQIRHPKQPDTALDITDLYPATGMQQGLLFHSMLEKGSYVTQILLRLENLNPALFRQAWQQLIARHSIFRTAFVGLDSANCHQLVLADAELPWQHVDLSEVCQNALQSEIDSIRVADKNKGFEPAQAPLMRMTSVKLTGDVYQLVWSHHHALLDGWCLPLVFAEVMECYRALLAGEAPQLDEVSCYRDYAAWLAQQDDSRAQDFWRELLSDVVAPTPLPLVVNGADEAIDESGEGVWLHTVTLSENQSGQLSALAQSAQTTVNVILQAAWALLLSRYASEQKVVFGATTAGRPPQLPGVEQMIGLFINSLPVAVDIDEQAIVTDWLQTLHRQLIEREAYNYIALGEIQQITHNQSLFDSLLVFENYPVDQAIQGQAQQTGLQVQAVETFDSPTFGITLTAHMGEVLSIGVEVQKHLMPEHCAGQISLHLQQLILALVQSADKTVADIELLNAAQKHQLVEICSNDKAYPQHQLIHHSFEAQVLQQPDDIAVVFEGQQISYRQLNEQANRLAHYLMSQGVCGGTLVGICVERSTTLPVAMLAVLKAGGAYVPLDPATPQGRMQLMFEDTGLRYLLTGSGLGLKTGLSADIQVVELDSETRQHQLLSYPPGNPSTATPADAANLAYVIYTSGSTGQPKGVMVEHNAVVNFLHGMKDTLAGVLDNKRKWLAVTTIAFDIAGLELLGPLSFGGQLVLASTEDAGDPSRLSQLLDYHDIDCMQATPATWQMLASAQWTGRQSLVALCGGEVLTVALADFVMAHCQQLFNCYGPTETAIWSLVQKVERSQLRQGWISLGGALPNYHHAVLDHRQRLVPVGAIGELCIGGAGVARGYLNRVEQTRHSFIENPIEATSSDRWYRTGDSVRVLGEGRFEFIGRTDQQVKIRGYRIEPGEISSQLARCDLVVQAVVLAHQQDNGDKQLVAYVQPHQRDGLTEQDLIGQLKHTLAQFLPQYMVPSAFIVMDKWPLSTNGKVDNKALPDPDGHLLQQQYVAPQTAIEQTLVDIWAELLQRESQSIGITTHFFDLGGHSLLAVKLVGQIRLHLSVEIELKAVFQHPTIKALAQLVERENTRQFIQQQKVNADIKEEGWL